MSEPQGEWRVDRRSDHVCALPMVSFGKYGTNAPAGSVWRCFVCRQDWLADGDIATEWKRIPEKEADQLTKAAAIERENAG